MICAVSAGTERQSSLNRGSLGFQPLSGEAASPKRVGAGVYIRPGPDPGLFSEDARYTGPLNGRLQVRGACKLSTGSEFQCHVTLIGRSWESGTVCSWPKVQ